MTRAPIYLPDYQGREYSVEWHVDEQGRARIVAPQQLNRHPLHRQLLADAAAGKQSPQVFQTMIRLEAERIQSHSRQLIAAALTSADYQSLSTLRALDASASRLVPCAASELAAQSHALATHVKAAYKKLLPHYEQGYAAAKGVMRLQADDVKDASGIYARSAGVYRDLRKDSPYLAYAQLDFLLPLGEGERGEVGDLHDRILLRLFEMRESAGIIAACAVREAESLPCPPVTACEAPDGALSQAVDNQENNQRLLEMLLPSAPAHVRPLALALDGPC